MGVMGLILLMIFTAPADVLVATGVAHNGHGQGESFPVQKKTQDPRLEEADKLNAQVLVLEEAGKPQEAIPLARRALQLRTQALGLSDLSVAQSLNNLAMLLYEKGDKGDYLEARSMYERALEIREKALGPDAADVGTILINLATLLEDQNDYPAAVSMYERGLRILEKEPGAERRVLRIQNILADLLFRQGNYRAERALVRRALAGAEKAFGPNSTDPEVAKILDNAAALERNDENYAEAKSLMERANAIFEKGDEPYDLAINLNNLANLLTLLGEQKRALSMWERSLKIMEDTFGPDHEGVALPVGSLARYFMGKGDYGAARPLFERAIGILEKADPPHYSEMASNLYELAEMLGEQGDYALAIEMQQRALEMRKKLGFEESLDLAQSLSRLARLYRIQGDYAKARPLLERALKIKEKALGSDDPGVASGFNNLAVVLLGQNDLTAARQYFKKGLAISEKAHDQRHIAITLDNLAFVSEKQNQYAEARAYREQALAILEKESVPDDSQLSITLINLGLLDWRQKELSQARQRFLHVGRITSNEIRRLLPILSMAEQRALLEKNLPEATSLLLSSCHDAVCLREAYDMLCQWKGLLIASLQRQTALARLGEDPKYKSQVDRLRGLRAKIAGWYQKASLVPLDEWKERYDALTQEKEVLERALSRDKGPGLLIDTLPNLDSQSLRSILRPDEAFVDLYYYSSLENGKFGEYRYGAVVIAPKFGPAFLDLGRASAINSTINSWRNEVLRGEDGAGKWQALASVVWKPLVDVLPRDASRIWLSPDGELARIPWQLLPTSDVKTREFLISQTNSARELISLRRKAATPNSAPTLLLAGGIDFNSGAKTPISRLRFKPLRGTELEVKSIQTLAETLKMPATVLMGAQASKEKIITQLQTVTFAHLATHGFFSQSVTTAEPVENSLTRSDMDDPTLVSGARNPLVESGIALAGANVRDPSTMEETGLLTAEELVGVDLSQCEMVTLSACETGRGEEISGQGVLGLRASVIAAGARSMVMSLWRVPDDASKAFMEAFYTNLWLKKLPRAESLLKAQDAVRNDPSGAFTRPQCWAGWVLVGESW